jgi:hypothetical protein
MGKPLQHFVGAEIGNNDDGDFPGQFDHALEKPRRRFTAVEWKIGNTCMSGTGRHGHGLSARQLLQELQLPPAQPAQPPPAIGAVTPDSLLERQQKLDKARSAWCLHFGHSAVSPHLLIGRINSNLVLQSGQIYS